MYFKIITNKPLNRNTKEIGIKKKFSCNKPVESIYSKDNALMHNNKIPTHIKPIPRYVYLLALYLLISFISLIVSPFY